MAFADLIVGKWNRNLFPWFTPGSRFSGCISFVSYIKPQPIIFYVLVKYVVYLSFPTSNHNAYKGDEITPRLYIFRFLHQTTTLARYIHAFACCISFVSYIKPQPSQSNFDLTSSCISFVSYIKPQPRIVQC